MRAFVLLSLFSCTAVACSGTDSSSGLHGLSGGAGGGGDGKYHPAASGVGVASADGCTKLSNAVSSKFQKLHCVGTTGICPGADAIKDSCGTFDEGTVDGCIAYFNEATTCDELRARTTGCAVGCL